MQFQKISFEEFIDLCILCGCDYTCTIPKVGPITSLNLIRKYHSIEKIPNDIPDSFNYKRARELFKVNECDKEIIFNKMKNKNDFIEILSRWNLNYFISKFNFCEFNLI